MSIKWMYERSVSVTVDTVHLPSLFSKVLKVGFVKDQIASSGITHGLLVNMHR